jgi:hypothetical protein
MATKLQKRREAQVEARLRKAFPDVFVVAVMHDEDGWLRGYLRPVDGGPSAREYFTPDASALPVAEVAAMVTRSVDKTLPRLVG